MDFREKNELDAHNYDFLLLDFEREVIDPVKSVEEMYQLTGQKIHRGLHLDDETMHIAIGIRLGTQICHIHTCPCGALVDALGLHCFVCRRSTGKQIRHNLLNDVIWRSFSAPKSKLQRNRWARSKIIKDQTG